MSSLEMLNSAQQEAVRYTEGPLLILAGAGSGKTRVLTHRVAYLIDECGVMPWNILAITFTNKAAGEMRERVDRIVGEGAQDVWVATFHSTCVRILRRYIDRLGYDRDFSIYDTDDQKTVIKEVCKNLQIDTKMYKESVFLSAISHAKEEMVGPELYMKQHGSDFRYAKIAEVFTEYQKRLKANNALDFDDLLLCTAELFRKEPDVLEYYQNRFRYIMVDEYQDTNLVQFKLVSMLAAHHHNLCVVGDDDQSIYKFRGADIRNILDFEKAFPDAKVIKLEQNYRSTKMILDGANGVIRHNRGRKSKTLWTENDTGRKIVFNYYRNEYYEADGIVSDINDMMSGSGCSYKDFAVLYRTHAQSRMLEEKCVMNGTPYRMVGGVNFYQRKEIKDLIAYLKTVLNGRDNVSVSRVINVPRRGVGAASIARANAYADEHGMSLFEAFGHASEIQGMGRTALKIEGFSAMIRELRKKAADMSLSELYDAILDETGYLAELTAEHTDEATTRIENLDEFRNKIIAYEETGEEPTLTGLLEEIALVADVDSMDESDDKVTLMTLHAA
ncbi:MAG: UvrD-helicase domain-containing protein, partial [Lachnospiraceae bacterium]|nr:UvrD-helicase domain-containing protein [Lachnospiraceae bacterium]